MSRYNYVRDFFHYLYCPFNRNSEIKNKVAHVLKWGLLPKKINIKSLKSLFINQSINPSFFGQHFSIKFSFILKVFYFTIVNP